MASYSDNHLNPQQKNAAETLEGPCIILAGAGSGKTRVLTHRVVNLIEKGIDPQSILMITFTNKAAKEMKQRIEDMLPGKDKPLATTFHAFCARILRKDAGRIGRDRGFVIYDTDDSLDAIKQVMKTHDISTRDIKPGAILHMISSAKNECIDPSLYAKRAYGDFQQTVALVYMGYQRLLAENNAVDFDDLLVMTVSLLTDHPDIRAKLNRQFTYILVDEYQDTNLAQYTLTRFLTGEQRNVCVVGDFSQSIYSWRGADFTNLMKFRKDFPDAQVFSLEQNYRSTQTILDAATEVISHNRSHPILHLWTENTQGDDITIYEARNEQDEALFIADYIESYAGSNNDIAILYRTNAQSRAIEEVLLHRGIPYRLIGGTRFYSRKEIKDVISMLRLVLNPQESIAKDRIEKIGKLRLRDVLAYRERVDAESENPLILLDGVVAASRYLDLYDQRDEEDRMRLENIKELRSVALAFNNLAEFLENIALIEGDQEKGTDESSDAVTLMTLHSAKGLEFPVVCIVGMEEGLFPHSRALLNTSELEEERRLAYVGITRAKQKLFLTYARRRLYFGQRNTSIVSRFISELPKKGIARETSSGGYNEDTLNEWT